MESREISEGQNNTNHVIEQEQLIFFGSCQYNLRSLKPIVCHFEHSPTSVSFVCSTIKFITSEVVYCVTGVKDFTNSFVPIHKRLLLQDLYDIRMCNSFVPTH